MAGNFIERSRHGTVYYFRRRVPRDLRERLRKRHIYVSLRTLERRVAILRARVLAARTDLAFEEMRLVPRDKDADLFQIDYTVGIDLDALTGKPKKVTIEAQPGEEQAVATLAAQFGVGNGNVSETSTPTIREAINDVLASDIKGRTKKEYKRFFEHFAQFFGETTRLGSIPQNEFARFAAAVRAEPTWADKSKTLRIVACARLFNFYEGINPAVATIKTKGLKPRRTRPAGQDREAFTLEDMRELFTGALRYREKEPAKWWITVAVAFLGCRVEELAQAHLMGDFTRDSATGAMVLNITEAVADPDEGDEAQASAKSVKTFAGWRKVPIHPILEEVGFVRFLEREAGRGLPTPFAGQWAPHRDDSKGVTIHSHAASKWAGRELDKFRAAGKITGRKTYFHSMRHLFVTLLANAGITEEWRAGLAGQAYGGVNAQVYNKSKEDVSQTLPLISKGLAPLEAVLRDVLK